MQRYLMRFSAACLHIENGTVAAGVAADVVTVTVAQKSSRQTLLHSHNSMHFCMCVHLCMCVCVCVWVHACKWQVEMHYSRLFRSAISQRAVVVAGGWVRAKVYVCVCVHTYEYGSVCVYARARARCRHLAGTPADDPTPPPPPPPPPASIMRICMHLAPLLYLTLSAAVRLTPALCAKRGIRCICVSPVGVTDCCRAALLLQLNKLKCIFIGDKSVFYAW